jgi:hypothetical protein
MTSERTVVLMDEPRRKLENLREFLPTAVDDVCELARVMASYIRPGTELNAAGVSNTCEIVFYDLQTGVNSWTAKPLSSPLVGNPPQFFAMLRTHLPELFNAILPAGFAAEVHAFMAEVQAIVSANDQREAALAMSMDEPRRKLENLREFIPKATAELCELGYILASYLEPTPQLGPRDFATVCNKVFKDLSAGVKYQRRVPGSATLTGNPQAFYITLRIWLPEVVKAVLPETFATEVNAILK